MSDGGFLQAVELFMDRHDMSATRFGVLAGGDTKLVKTLREGRRPRAKTVKAIREWMQKFEGA